MFDPEKMAIERMSFAGQKAMAQLADTNIDQMIASLGRGIAEAQFELDTMSVGIARLMSGEYEVAVDQDGEPKFDDRGRPILIKGSTRVEFDGEQLSLLELGFTPTFYQFTETVIEVKVSISLDADVDVSRSETRTTTTKETRGFFRKKTKTTVHSVSTRYSASFQYSVEGSSYVRTTLVPAPPPPALIDVLQEAVSEARGTS